MSSFASQPAHVNATPALPDVPEPFGPWEEIEVLPPEGLTFGAPDYISAETLRIDRQAAARMKCGKCKRRGLLFEAYTDTQHGTYSPRATCPDSRCGFEEVL